MGDHIVSKRNSLDAHAQLAIRREVFALLRGDHVQLGLCALEAHAGTHPSEDGARVIAVLVAPPVHPFEPIERDADRGPGVDILREAGARWHRHFKPSGHDAHDDRRLTVDPDGLTDHPPIFAEPAAPQRMTEDQRGGWSRCSATQDPLTPPRRPGHDALIGIEGPPDVRADT